MTHIPFTGRITRRVIVPLAAATAMVIGLGTLSASAATSGPAAASAHVAPDYWLPPGGEVLWNYNTNLCADDSNAYGLRAYGCNLLSYQRWDAISTSNGWQLRNENTGLCMDDSLAYGLRGFPCNGSSYADGYQAWYVSEENSSGFQLENGATTLCLDDSWAYGLRGFPCNDPSFENGYQSWAYGPH